MSRIGQSVMVNYPHKKFEGEIGVVVNEYDTDYEFYYRVKFEDGEQNNYEVFSATQLNFNVRPRKEDK